MLSDIRKDCIRYAKCLGDYQSMTCDELANGYCKARDEEDSIKDSQFLAALVLRFWYTIDKMYRKSPVNGVDHEECYCWLVESINYACKYRKWQDPANKVNAQQCINQCIETIRLQHYYEFNLDKHKANYNTVSMDQTVGEEGDSQSLTTFADTIVGDESAMDSGRADVEFAIQHFIDKKKIDQAIIMDIIAFNDCEKHTKEVVRGVDEEGNPTKYTKNYSEFWPFRVVQILSKLPDDYKEYFSGKYHIVTEELDAVLAAIRKANNQKLYKYVDKTLESLKAYFKA